MKRILAIVLVLMMGVTVFPVYGQSNALTGKYSIVALEIDGMDMMALFTMMGMDMGFMYIELLDGNRFRMAMDEDEATEGIFSLSGKNLTLTAEGENLAAVFEGNRIIIEQEGDPESGFELSRMIFEKK